MVSEYLEDTVRVYRLEDHTRMLTLCSSYALHYKGIPYRTEWLEYPEIKPTLKNLGAPPTAKDPDGSDRYTLPTILDPSTGKVVTDSLPIAKYLDATYPDTPRLLPPGTENSQQAFHDMFFAEYALALYLIIIKFTSAALNPESSAYFERTKAERMGKPWEELEQNTPGQWVKFESSMAELKDRFSEGDYGDGAFLNGNQITFSDFIVAACLLWAKVVCGKESDIWKRIIGMHDGFWGRYMKQFEKYEVVD